MSRTRRKWTDFPTDLIDVVERFDELGHLTLGPITTAKAINLRNEIYRFRSAINQAVHDRDDMSIELMRMHTIVRDLTISVELFAAASTAGPDHASIVIEKNLFGRLLHEHNATVEKLSDTLNEALPSAD